MTATAGFVTAGFVTVGAAPAGFATAGFVTVFKTVPATGLETPGAYTAQSMDKSSQTRNNTRIKRKLGNRPRLRWGMCL